MKIFKCLIILTGVLFTSNQVFAEEPEITSWDENRYIQDFGGYYFYIVDTKINKCFLSFRNGLTPLDCKDLLKREPWKKIITWVEAK